MATAQVQVRDAIVTVVKAVAKVGTVHNRARYSSSDPDFLDNFTSVIDGKKVIRGWWISIPTVTELGSEFATMDTQADQLEYVLYGVMGFNDKEDSETVFEDLIYTVRHALRRQTTLGLGSSVVIPHTITVTMPLVQLTQYGSRLCHFCEIHIYLAIPVPISWA